MRKETIKLYCELTDEEYESAAAVMKEEYGIEPKVDETIKQVEYERE